MKKIIFALLIALSSLFAAAQTNEQSINTLLDDWHKAAADANFESYFNKMTSDAIFIGTDAHEIWNKEAFMNYAKPYFDKGKAWSFTAVNRNIYFSKTQHNIAWFDENLDTQMKICRGSGVVVKINGKWYIQHYVLSMTIPNDVASEVIKVKSDIETKTLERLKKQ